MNVINDEVRFKTSQKIIWITIILNIVLAAGKIIIGLTSKSNAILADGIHTLSDIASSLGLIVGLFIAAKPEDLSHQYGHEKAESIATFLLSLLLLAVGLNIGYSSIKIMISGDIAVPGVAAIYAAAVSVLIKELQFRISLKAGKKLNSNALIADAWHHRSDALSSIAALVGIAGARMGYKFLDPLAGLIVSIIVIKAGIDIFIGALNELMDVSIEIDKIQSIVDKIMKNEEIKTINDIKARKHGSKVYVDIEIAVNPDITVAKGHDIAEDVEGIIYNDVGNVKDVLVHVNPCYGDNDENCSICTNKRSEFVKRKK